MDRSYDLIFDPGKTNSKKVSQGGQDLRDLWDFFVACGERPFGQRPLYPDDLVNPACPMKPWSLLFHRGLFVF
jgi:hypothetical protein